MRLLLLNDFKSRWVEYLLGSILISIVTGALMLQRAVSASAEGQIHELAHRLGKNMLVLPDQMDLAGFYKGKYGSTTMPAEYSARLSSSALSAHIRTNDAMLYGNIEIKGTPVIIAGIDPWQAATRAAYVGTEAAARLGLQDNGVIDINGTVLGVADILASPPDGLDRGVFTSLDWAQQILGKPQAINALRLGGCWCRIDVETLAKDVERLLPGTRAITVASMIKAQKGSIGVMERYSGVLYFVGVAIIMGTIVLLISSQVRRHLPEIGLLLAMGASPRMVSGLFVLKAGVVGAIGALTGIPVGAILTSYLGSKLLGAPLMISSQTFIPLFLSCIILSMVAALIPALRAARLDPAEVLRND